MINIEELQLSKNKLKALKQWSDRIGSDEYDEINQIVSLLENQESYLENLSKRCIIWGVDDFISQAEERWNFTKDSFGDIYINATKWQDIYDEAEFEYALEKMIDKHDAEYGISWESINFYLDEFCLKK